MEAQGGEGKDALYSTDGWGTVLLISVYEEARRTTSPLQVSYPPGKLHFSFTSSPTDTHNTVADFKVC
jgi:hypothetical protein